MTPEKTSDGAQAHNILVALCPEPSVEHEEAETLKAAAAYAEASGGRVALLAVAEPPAELDRIARAAGVARQEIEKRLLADARARAEAIVRRAAPDLDAEIDICIGKPFLEIVRCAMARNIDIVIKTAEALSAGPQGLFASTDQHLLRKCPATVWLRKRGETSTPKTVLAAVDVDEATAVEPETLAGLNRRILETSVRVAAGRDAVIYLLHAWDAPGEGLVRLWANAPDGDRAAADYVSDVQSTHRRALDEIAARARKWAASEGIKGIKIQSRLERGGARQVIPAQARALKADIVVMGAIARTGVPGFIIGNTAEDILNSIDCSVAAVKPPNYVSPLSFDDAV